MLILKLDIDGDGESKPLTDGLLLIRYLFGFSGDSLISGAIGTGAERIRLKKLRLISRSVFQLNKLRQVVCL